MTAVVSEAIGKVTLGDRAIDLEKADSNPNRRAPVEFDELVANVLMAVNEGAMNPEMAVTVLCRVSRSMTKLGESQLARLVSQKRVKDSMTMGERVAVWLKKEEPRRPIQVSEDGGLGLKTAAVERLRSGEEARRLARGMVIGMLGMKPNAEASKKTVEGEAVNRMVTLGDFDRAMADAIHSLRKGEITIEQALDWLFLVANRMANLGQNELATIAAQVDKVGKELTDKERWGVLMGKEDPRRNFQLPVETGLGLSTRSEMLWEAAREAREFAFELIAVGRLGLSPGQERGPKDVSNQGGGY